MNLSPWFKPSEPPEHEGLYQAKDWIGRINYLRFIRGTWWNGANLVPTHRIRAWRGLVKP